VFEFYFLGKVMRKLGISILLAGFLFGCNKASIYSGGPPDFGAVVELNQWPPLPKGVAGYNVYMSKTAAGKFEKINDTPVTGGKVIVPKLERGKDYFFKMTAVTAAGAESVPSRVITHKAGYLSDGVVKPTN
jgi:hypothetical protein